MSNNELVCEELLKQYKSSTFQPFKSDDGRPKIPLMINGITEYVMFDTGSSIFTLQTTKKDALQTASPRIADSLSVFSWGRKLMFYGVKTNKTIKFGNKVLNGWLVYYDEQETFQDFYKFAKIWFSRYSNSSFVLMTFRALRSIAPVCNSSLLTFPHELHPL